jgi:hypothetical protein
VNLHWNFFGDILAGEDLQLFEQIFKCKGYNILLVGAFVVQFYEKNSSDSKIKLFAVLFDFWWQIKKSEMILSNFCCLIWIDFWIFILQIFIFLLDINIIKYN